MRAHLIYPPTLLVIGLLALTFLVAVLRLLRADRSRVAAPGTTPSAEVPAAGSTSPATPRSTTTSTSTATATVPSMATAAPGVGPAWLDRRVLSSEGTPFARLAAVLLARGYLLQAQGPGEDPELATYARDEVRVAYRSEPRTGLRTLEMKDPAGQAARLMGELLAATDLVPLDRAAVTAGLASPEKTALLRALHGLEWLVCGPMSTSAGPALLEAERTRLEALADSEHAQVAAEARRLRTQLG